MKTFSDIRNHLYDDAERYWWISLLLGLSVQFISIVSLFFPNDNFIGFLGTLFFFVPIVVMWFRELSKDNALKGSKCRLAILYSDAFGQDIPFELSREIKSWVKKEKIARAPFKRPYYDSKLPYGPNRLADIVSESAFWTYNLALDMRTIMWVYAGVYLISVFTLIIFILQLSLAETTTLLTIKIVLIFASLIFTSEIGILIKEYSELFMESKQVFLTTAKMKAIKKLSVSEIMQIVEGYNLLLVSSPPLPGFLYKWKHKNLNKAYKLTITNE